MDTADDPRERPTSNLDAPDQPLREGTSLQIGDTIDGKYEIQGVLGSGGMGTVYLARDPTLDRTVGLKLIHEDMLAAPEHRSSFAEEARAMARVRHPNVVTIHALGEHSGQPYIVMEHIEGVDLATRLVDDAPLPWENALGILDALCQAVQAIHDAGAVHRDIKASNVLVEDRGRVALSDLGLSLPVEELLERRGDFALGTPSNIAPEIARDESVIPQLATRIDVYALGVLAYELLTGRHPFDAKSIPGLLQQHAYTPATAPSKVRDELPTAFDAAVLRALAKDPKARTPSATQFRRELLEAVQAAEDFPEGLKILTVDDDAIALLAVRELLLEAFPGAEVISQTDPVQAAEMAARERPDIVVTDLHMPKGGGKVLCETLRGDPKTAEIPIVVITGEGGASDWHHLRGIGVDRFLMKPVDFDTLESAVWALCRER